MKIPKPVALATWSDERSDIRGVKVARDARASEASSTSRGGGQTDERDR